MKFPTLIARRILEEPIKAVLSDDGDAVKAVAQFQRMSAVVDFDTACKGIQPFLKGPFKEIVNVDLLALLRVVHEIVKPDILGYAVEALIEITQKTSGVMAKDRVAAATILNELYGEKELIKDEKLSDRLIIGLIGKDK